MYCVHCGQSISSGDTRCPHCGRSVPPQYQMGAGGSARWEKKDEPSMALNVLCFFFSIVGLVLYIVWKDEMPRKAAGVGKAALLGVLVPVLLYALAMCGMVGLNPFDAGT